MKVGVILMFQIYESMMKVQLYLDFWYFQMDKTLICINVFFFSYHSHNFIKVLI
jgi:hypothetical protein